MDLCTSLNPSRVPLQSIFSNLQKIPHWNTTFLTSIEVREFDHSNFQYFKLAKFAKVMPFKQFRVCLVLNSRQLLTFSFRLLLYLVSFSIWRAQRLKWPTMDSQNLSRLCAYPAFSASMENVLSLFLILYLISYQCTLVFVFVCNLKFPP